MYKRFENFLNENEYNIAKSILEMEKWSLTGKSNYNDDKSLWYYNLTSVEFFKETVFKKIEDVTGMKFIITNIQGNGQIFGQDGNWHPDNEDDEYYTFLYYFTKFEDVTLIGETYFKDENQNIEIALPIPNSAIFFNSTILHKGMGPRKGFDGLRVSVAYKLKLIGNIKNNKSLL